MSADNWRVCPRCLKKAQEDQEKAKKKAADSYGKVPAETYIKLLEASKAEIDLECTLREDYEMGITEAGKFYVRYSGSCRNSGCFFSHEFDHEEHLSP